MSLDWSIDDEKAQSYTDLLERQRPVVSQTEWVACTVVGELPDGKPMLAEHFFTARSLSDREAKMEALGIDRQTDRYAAGHLDDDGKPVDVGSDPVVRARLRRYLPTALRR